MKLNVEHLTNIHQYHNKLAREIDEAEWMGDFDHADFLSNELEHVKDLIDKGSVYYPLF